MYEPNGGHIAAAHPINTDECQIICMKRLGKKFGKNQLFYLAIMTKDSRSRITMIIMFFFFNPSFQNTSPILVAHRQILSRWQWNSWHCPCKQLNSSIFSNLLGTLRWFGLSCSNMHVWACLRAISSSSLFQYYYKNSTSIPFKETKEKLYHFFHIHPMYTLSFTVMHVKNIFTFKRSNTLFNGILKWLRAKWMIRINGTIFQWTRI